ncbi:DUF7287 family protein [Halosimplex halophilum]|uniref:DUF7287 family protein n=1 Tax=Halosimplex halophilum TaxID=2559572 RepID=UPI00143545D2|nr:hypothetical protein [Halosimplex halophilum]
MNRDTHRLGADDRGQSVFDFSIGVTLFLVVVLGVVVFVPTAFGSLSDDSGIDDEDRLAAERVADHLADTALSGSEGQPGLARHCVLAFFDGGVSCGFGTGNSIAADTAGAVNQPFNVTIEKDIGGNGHMDVACWDEGAEDIVRVSACPAGSGTVLARGPNANRNRNYVTVKRFAQFEGENVFVVVRAW